MATSAHTEGARSLRRALAILRLLAAGQEAGVRLTDLAASTGLSRPTLHRILRVLVEEGAVDQDPETRRYMIGPEVSLLGLARKTHFPIRAFARPCLEHLGRHVGDTVFLSLRVGFDSVCVDRVLGGYPLQVLALEVGARRPLGVGVSGVAMLGAMPKEAAEAVLVANASRFLQYQQSAEALAERVALARSLGYAYAPSGIVKGTRALAVPIEDPAGQMTAAISIAGLADRLGARRLEPTVAMMREQAAQITKRLEERYRRRGRAR